MTTTIEESEAINLDVLSVMNLEPLPFKESFTSLFEVTAYDLQLIYQEYAKIANRGHSGFIMGNEKFFNHEADGFKEATYETLMPLMNEIHLKRIELEQTVASYDKYKFAEFEAVDFSIYVATYKEYIRKLRDAVEIIDFSSKLETILDKTEKELLYLDKIQINDSSVEHKILSITKMLHQINENSRFNPKLENKNLFIAYLEHMTNNDYGTRFNYAQMLNNILDRALTDETKLRLFYIFASYIVDELEKNSNKDKSNYYIEEAKKHIDDLEIDLIYTVEHP